MGLRRRFWLSNRGDCTGGDPTVAARAGLFTDEIVLDLARCLASVLFCFCAVFSFLKRRIMRLRAVGLCWLRVSITFSMLIRLLVRSASCHL